MLDGRIARAVPRAFRLTLPWMLLLVAVWASVLIIGGTAPAACDDLPDAFARGMDTEVSGDQWGFVSRCQVTDRATGVTTEATEVNWSGIVASAAGCVAAWVLGAVLGGLIERRHGLIVALVSLFVSAGALVVFFV